MKNTIISILIIINLMTGLTASFFMNWNAKLICRVDLLELDTKEITDLTEEDLSRMEYCLEKVYDITIEKDEETEI